MRIERDETATAYFDEIIYDFASIRHGKCCFKHQFCLIYPERAGYVYVSIRGGFKGVIKAIDLLKPTKITLFTMISCNSENRVDDISRVAESEVKYPTPTPTFQNFRLRPFHISDSLT